MSSELSRLVDTVLGNPFQGAVGEWREAGRRLLARDVGHHASAEQLLARAAAEVLQRQRSVSEALERTPERALARAGLSREQLRRLLSAARRCYAHLAALAGASAALRQVRAAAWGSSFGGSLATTLRLERVIREHDVLIVGETGTGKEAVAHAIARGTLASAGEAEAPLAALNVAAIPETLVESELFGHVRGAFTGASKTRIGHIRSVASGCLFLDEVGDLPATAQSKLLRVMETDRVTPLGSDQTFDADVRYITATHKDLREMVARGAFREDLYERLAGQVIRLPALRERPEDISPIGLEFAKRYLAPHAPEWRAIKRFLASAEARSHCWPGNVRELQNCLRNVMLGLDPGLLPTSTAVPSQPVDVPSELLEGRAPLAEVERWYLLRVLAKCDHNQARAARTLGIDRTTVARKLGEATGP